MADSTSLIPCLPNLVPHTVTQDASFVGTNSDPIPFPPDVSYGDWMPAGGDNQNVCL